MNNLNNISFGTRGCGKRIAGGLYATCLLSPYGLPIEHFLIDPVIHWTSKASRSPMIINAEEFIRNEKNKFKGKVAIFYVGSKFYKYATDFIEEVRNKGVSKRIPCNEKTIEQFKDVKAMMFYHSRCFISQESLSPIPMNCPKSLVKHINGEEHCITRLYEIISEEDTEKERTITGDIKIVRKIGDLKYEVPKTMSETDFIKLKDKLSTGIFLWTPFSELHYVKPIEDKPRKTDAIIEKHKEIRICQK